MKLMWKLILLLITLALILFIGAITYFFEGLFVVILSLSLTEFDLLVILLILTIFLKNIIKKIF